MAEYIEGTSINNHSGNDNILELKGINQEYTNKDGSKFQLFENLDFAIKDHHDKGQFIVMMGESGCGKSTILRYLTGLQKPTSGEIFIKGNPLTHQDTIPMVFQNPSSLEWYSVLDNVALPLILKGTPKKQAHEQAMEMIKVVGLEGHQHKFAKYPLLSGGQLQRVAIARSLVANPSMIVMDEPFSALDAKNRKHMQLFLADMFYRSEVANLNPTIILVTHSAKEAVFLANDLYIFGANPGRVKLHIPIEHPHRVDTRRTQEFLELVTYVEEQL